MKILTFNLNGHDANVTYYDGSEARYILLERTKQIKKFFYDNDEFAQVKDDIKLLGIDYDNLDAVGFVALDRMTDLDWKFTYGGPVREVSEETFEEAFPFLNIKAKKYYRIRHHYAHKRSADWLYGDMQRGLVIDGHGDYAEHISVYDGSFKTVEYKMTDMLSIGRLYALTSLHFLKPGVAPKGGVIDQVGKVMGLMSYGEFNDEYANWLRQFPFDEVTTQMYNRMKFEQFQHQTKPDPIPECTQTHFGFMPTGDMVDWAHTWQEVLFDYMIDFCKEHFDKDEHFSYSGGVAHNVCFNERLSKEFPNVVIPPCVGDESLSLGVMYELLSRHGETAEFPKGQYTTELTEVVSHDTIDFIVEQIILGKVVANFQGYGEIGPRALGRRSIFFRPDLMHVPTYFNERHIKSREWWRPYGIIILEEELENYLDTTTKSPYMLHTAQVKNVDALKGVVHADNSVRYQTVSKDDGWLYDIVKSFYDKTGVPAIVNTSLNAQGYPIMHSKADFIKYMQTTPGDVFVMGNDIWCNNV